MQKPIRWLKGNDEIAITHVILAARLAGTKIAPGSEDLQVGIAYVTDQTLLFDSELDFAKGSYVAIGVSHETDHGAKPNPNKQIQSG